MSTSIISGIGMLLFIKFSGGMGISYQGSVDLSTLPDNLLKAVHTEMSENNLSKIANRKNNPLLTDAMIYELHYEASNQTYRIGESQATPELLEVFDSLRPFLKLEPG